LKVRVDVLLVDRQVVVLIGIVVVLFEELTVFGPFHELPVEVDLVDANTVIPQVVRCDPVAAADQQYIRLSRVLVHRHRDIDEPVVVGVSPTITQLDRRI
jgi:hypothetical protein